MRNREMAAMALGAALVPRRARTEYVTREVHEHRAPTDESVELLREMEAKARAEVLKSIKVATTEFECVAHRMEDCNSADTVYRAVFSLNGCNMAADHRVHWQSNPSLEEIGDGIRKAIADKIACEAFRSFVPVFMQKMRHID